MVVYGGHSQVSDQLLLFFLMWQYSNTSWCLGAPPWVYTSQEVPVLKICHVPVTTYSQSYLSITGLFGWREAQLSLSLVSDGFCLGSFFLTSSKEPVTMLPFPFTQTRLELPTTKRTPHEGERENWNLPLVKSVSVMYNNLGWTSPSSIVGVQMSHVKAPEDTPKTTEMLHSRKVWGFTVTPTFI